MTPSPKERFAAYLAGKAQRFTRQMERVVDESLSLSGPFDGEYLAASLAGAVSRATLFRTLSKLVESGLLREVQFNGRAAYVASGSDDESLPH